MVGEPFENLLVAASAACRIPVPTLEAGARRDLADKLLDPLGTASEIPDTIAAAVRTLGGDWHAGVAAVADELGGAFMKREGRITARAVRDQAAVPAHNERVGPTAVEEEDGLFA